MTMKVEFKKSGKSAQWDGRHDSLLELAEDSGVSIDSECRQGFCGTCKTKLLSGEVDMDVTDGLDEGDEEENMILPCVAVPKTDVDLDA
ncbi:MAG: 2Fe-2S iron-sulfur cluster binding domain-containing protein [Deltaproteobacteria bacterium]|nr:2Fe-2S iron-sulfur cluster binding domain-containing protein [Deltaproteobacteria bacterium]